MTGPIDLSGERLADYLKIHHALMRYNHGVDRCDAAALKSAFWPQATCNYSGKDENAHQWSDNTVTALATMKRTQHTVGNYLIEFTGPSSATSETYCIAYHLIDGPNGLMDMVVGGRYLDRHEKRGGEWRILSRYYLMDWNQNGPSTGEWKEGMLGGLNTGARMPHDAYYKLFKA